jgi:DNA cross-link repair 1A protein
LFFQPNWRRGPIYCSPISGRLLETMLNMNTEHNQIRPLEINIRHRIDDQFWVTLYNANHCIGSVMFLFEIDNYSTVLCTGDMRFDDKMIEMFDNIDIFQRLQTVCFNYEYYIFV